jgi:hypothetical protein
MEPIVPMNAFVRKKVPNVITSQENAFVCPVGEEKCVQNSAIPDFSVWIVNKNVIV